MIHDKRRLMEQINSLGPTEHTEIYKILACSNTPYTENANGVFFNLTTLPAEVFTDIQSFVQYCHENKDELDEYDKKLNECKYRNIARSTYGTAGIYHSAINEPTDKKDRWKDLMERVDKSSVVRDFIEKINSHTEKQLVKRTGTKYLMAKKKYAKRTVADNDMKDTLGEESYEST